MTVERKIDENGAVTEIITLTEEENAAVNTACEIVSERYKQLGTEQTAWEKELRICTQRQAPFRRY